MKTLIIIAVLAVVALGTWLLTGFDKSPSGESKRDHHLTRAVRTVGVVFLLAIFILVMGGNPGLGGAPFLIIIPMSIAIILRSSLSEVFAHGFLGLIDPELRDKREFDPKKAQRYQDAIAHLIQKGRREEAIRLCEELKESGEVDIITLQNTLEYLGVKQERVPVKPLAQADGLRTEGKFAEAEQLLKSLLVRNPADDAAAIMLMRLYAQDLRQPERAYEVLHALEKQPHVSADHLEFARRSIPEWVRAQHQPPVTPGPAKAESVDELMAHGGLGTAIELLEQQIKTQPANFDARLKLAEVYAIGCQNLPRAEKILQQAERVPNVSPQQVAVAQAKLREWHLTSGRQRSAT